MLREKEDDGPIYWEWRDARTKIGLPRKWPISRAKRYYCVTSYESPF